MTKFECYASDPAVYAGLVDLQMDVDKLKFWSSIFQRCPGFRKLKNDKKVMLFFKWTNINLFMPPVISLAKMNLFMVQLHTNKAYSC